ncbi:hypothetical protein RRG08_001607 [Elysia crispata]|uniref:Uncharacterized protein n=1 Tax=Elysia crispata TaxID=231223 RepID=A0AAE1AK50_9GAST|nr:hypothetical protein RRG08_001607 [Elysia crispata]
MPASDLHFDLLCCAENLTTPHCTSSSLFEIASSHDSVTARWSAPLHAMRLDLLSGLCARMRRQFGRFVTGPAEKSLRVNLSLRLVRDRQREQKEWETDAVKGCQLSPAQNEAPVMADFSDTPPAGVC